MRTPRSPNTVVLILALLSLTICSLGTKACQEDYDFGSRASVGTTTPTETPTETPDGSETPTPTSSPTPPTGATPSPTPSPSPTGNVITPTATPTGSETPTPSPTGTTASLVGDGRASMSPKNWLGQAFTNEQTEDDSADDLQDFSDQDQDGFSDALEERFGTNSQNQSSTPPLPRSSLAARLARTDADLDGLSDADERERGTALDTSDTDGDGCTDFAEALSESDPLAADSLPDADIDRDCLTSSYEMTLGLDSTATDTDSDRVADDIELALGCSPFAPDTDGDGIADWKEIELGSDPLFRDLQ